MENADAFEEIVIRMKSQIRLRGPDLHTVIVINNVTGERYY